METAEEEITLTPYLHSLRNKYIVWVAVNHIVFAGVLINE